jgi:NAD-dependent dihydropyrimidine dehydrogenase PreA subunit
MPELSRRQILVGRLPAGVHGLDELFEEMYAQERQPDEPGLDLELSERARAHNYIPKGAEQEYAEALVHEYRQYVGLRTSGGQVRRIDYGTWRGYPREQIPWFPTVALDLCDGCGACLKFCSFGVYRATSDGKAIVAEPFRCQVRCSMCVNACPPHAISFPPRTILGTYRPGGQ